MKTKLFLVGMFLSSLTHAQWSTSSCSGTDMINTNTGGRVGINDCPGTGTYTQYDKLTVGGRIKISKAESTFWTGNGGPVIGMDPDSLLVLIGGRGGVFINGDITGMDVNCLWAGPNGNIGIGTITPADKLTVKGNVVPDADGTYRCGSSGLKWSEVWATNGTIQTSDKRHKKDIKNLDYGLAEVLQLKPVSYRWKSDKGGVHLGLIAQDLQSVIKEVVIEGEDKDKNLGVAYAELIPVLIKAIQEQQQEIENLKKVTTSINTNPAVGNSTDFEMGQNIPNPFTHETTIRYTLPQKTTNAWLAVYDLSGKQITSWPIPEKGSSSLTIKSDKLPAGIYIYSIVADGQLIDSKKMIVAEK